MLTADGYGIRRNFNTLYFPAPILESLQKEAARAAQFQKFTSAADPALHILDPVLVALAGLHADAAIRVVKLQPVPLVVEIAFLVIPGKGRHRWAGIRVTKPAVAAPHDGPLPFANMNAALLALAKTTTNGFSVCQKWLGGGRFHGAKIGFARPKRAKLAVLADNAEASVKALDDKIGHGKNEHLTPLSPI